MTNKDMGAKGRVAMIWGTYELLTQTESEKEKMLGILKLVAQETI